MTAFCMAGLLGFIAKLAKQPVIPFFILAGVIAGPVTGWISDPELIQQVGEISIIFVMINAGLEMNLARMRSLGMVVVLGGLAQFLMLAALGTGIAQFFMPLFPSFCIGILLAFGSTALSINIMTTQRQLNTTHGGISLGILLLQDVIAVAILSILPAKSGIDAVGLIKMVVATFGVLAMSYGFSKKVVPWMICRVWNDPMMILVVSVGAGGAASLLSICAGLSPAIGAFVVGATLANADFELDILSRIKPLRDFFLPIFFCSIGIMLKVPPVSTLAMVGYLLIAALIMKPVIIAAITSLFGYQRRTSWNVGAYLTPISEFGLVIIMAAHATGKIPDELISVAVTLMTLSMVFSVYLSNDGLSEFAISHLKVLDRIGPDARFIDENIRDDDVYDVVLVGCHRAGRYILNHLLAQGLRVVVIEHDLQRALRLRRNRHRCIIGDATQHETWDEVPNLDQVQVVISTFAEMSQSLCLLHHFSADHPHIRVVLSADETNEAHALMKANPNGAVISPHILAGIAIRMGIFDKLIFGALERFGLVESQEQARQASQDVIDTLEHMMDKWGISPCLSDDFCHLKQ